MRVLFFAASKHEEVEMPCVPCAGDTIDFGLYGGDFIAREKEVSLFGTFLVSRVQYDMRLRRDETQWDPSIVVYLTKLKKE